MKKGTQVIYAPQHAGGNVEHSDCEAGFVTSISRGGDVFCRFWNKHEPGELRTKANSELTPFELLVVRDTVPQEQVEMALMLIKGGL